MKSKHYSYTKLYTGNLKVLPHSRPTVEKDANEKTAHLEEHGTSHLLSAQFLFSIKVRLHTEIGGKPPAEKAPHTVKQILKNEMKTIRLSCKLVKCEKIKKTKQKTPVSLKP